MESDPSVTNWITKHIEKVNKAVHQHTQGLPESQKAYVTKVLMSMAYLEITPETAFERIQAYFREQAVEDICKRYETVEHHGSLIDDTAWSSGTSIYFYPSYTQERED